MYTLYDFRYRIHILCMYTLYNDFKYKNTYLRVCIPYIMTYINIYLRDVYHIRIHIFVYVYLIYKNIFVYVYLNDFKYKNKYLRVCIPYIMTLNIRIHIFVYVYLI